MEKFDSKHSSDSNGCKSKSNLSDKKYHQVRKKIHDMSFDEMINMKIFQENKEEILKKAFEEAKRMCIKESAFHFETVTFKVNYVTNFGEVVCMTGGGRVFGNWDADNKSIRLQWTDGHFWSISVAASELPNEGEFKFVIIEGDKVKRWATGNNKLFNLDKIKESMSMTQMSQSTFLYSYQASLNRKLDYDPKNKELVILDTFE